MAAHLPAIARVLQKAGLSGVPIADPSSFR